MAIVNVVDDVAMTVRTMTSPRRHRCMVRTRGVTRKAVTLDREGRIMAVQATVRGVRLTVTISPIMKSVARSRIRLCAWNEVI